MATISVSFSSQGGLGFMPISSASRGWVLVSAISAGAGWIISLVVIICVLLSVLGVNLGPLSQVLMQLQKLALLTAILFLCGFVALLIFCFDCFDDVYAFQLIACLVAVVLYQFVL